jgi:hypothetical protein
MPPEFSMRSDSVDVDQIMKQIRARVRDKRGVDYTEEEIRQLASVKLEQFLDPTRVRSDLVQHYRRTQGSGSISTLVPPPDNYAFDDHLVYGSARGAGGRLITSIRTLLNPVLKLFINPNPIINVLHRQSAINVHNEEQFERIERVRTDLAALNYEVVHNLVVEMTRLSIEVKNLKMRVESLSSRLDFSDRRARALESVVQYRPGMGPGAEVPQAVAPAPPAPRTVTGVPASRESDTRAASGPIKGEAQRARRRRRRRGRGGANGQPDTGGGPLAGDAGGPQDPGSAPARQEAVAGDGDSSLPFERDTPVSTERPPEPSGDQTDQ